MKSKYSISPLYFMADGSLVCYQFGDIIIVNNGQELRRFTIFKSIKERLLARFKLLRRLLRIGIRTTESIDDKTIVISIDNSLYELDIESGEISKGFNCGNGIRPLIITSVKKVFGFEKGLYFGGYLSNRKKRAVNVYHRTGTDQWDVVYSFPQGTINHIHNIVEDPYRQCLWIFTGDFDEASAIWKVTDNFKIIERVVFNHQKYRGCVAFALPEGLLYATDTPFADNYIYLMNTDTYETTELLPIDGSCIYGCKWKNAYVFSSTVEGDGRNTPLFDFLLGRKRGVGIKNDYVHMYMGNLDDGFKEVYKEKKDCMPYYTFQFGVFRFPYGINNSDILYFQPVATQENDQCLMKYSSI